MSQTNPTPAQEADKNHFLHPFTSIAEHQEAGAHMMTGGKGIRIMDDQGREFIDAMAGLWCVDVGYGRSEIAKAVAEQIETMSYYHAFMGVSNEPSALLSERLSKLTPGKVNRFFYCNSGSEANDTQIKLIWYYNNLLGRPEKKKIIARRNAYHGVTIASASASGLPHMHAKFDLPIDRFVHVKKPHYYWEADAGMSEEEFSQHLAKDLEETIEREGPETCAAFFAEPVMGAGGVIVPPKGYFEAIMPILKKHDILFVADEVVCGFGRLGEWFGSTYYGIEPDLMTMAKGLTSGYVPMSACGISEDIWAVLNEHSSETGPFAHGYTYSAHPVAAATALANLDIIEGERLPDNAKKVGAHLQKRLAESIAPHPLVGEHRGAGLIAGIELVKDKAKKEPWDPKEKVGGRMYGKLLEQGLICRPIVNMLAFSPPLIITESDVDEVIEKFATALSNLAAELKTEGVWQG